MFYKPNKKGGTILGLMPVNGQLHFLTALSTGSRKYPWGKDCCARHLAAETISLVSAFQIGNNISLLFC